MSKKNSRFWRITLMKQHMESVVAEIPTTHITDRKLVALLKMLFVKHFLTDEEAVAAHLCKTTKRYRNLIPVQAHHSQDPISYMLPSGGDWIHAIVVRPEDPKPTKGG